MFFGFQCGYICSVLFNETSKGRSCSWRKNNNICFLVSNSFSCSRQGYRVNQAFIWEMVGWALSYPEVRNVQLASWSALWGYPNEPPSEPKAKGKRKNENPQTFFKKTMYIVYIVYKFQHFLQTIVNFGGKDGKGRKQRETVQTLFGLFGGNQFVFVHRKIGVSTTQSNSEGWTNRNMIARSFSFSTIIARYYPPCN